MGGSAYQGILDKSLPDPQTQGNVSKPRSWPGPKAWSLQAYHLVLFSTSNPELPQSHALKLSRVAFEVEGEKKLYFFSSCLQRWAQASVTFCLKFTQNQSQRKNAASFLATVCYLLLGLYESLCLARSLSSSNHSLFEGQKVRKITFSLGIECPVWGETLLSPPFGWSFTSVHVHAAGLQAEAKFRPLLKHLIPHCAQSWKCSHQLW